MILGGMTLFSLLLLLILLGTGVKPFFNIFPTFFKLGFLCRGQNSKTYGSGYIHDSRVHSQGDYVHDRRAYSLPPYIHDGRAHSQGDYVHDRRAYSLPTYIHDGRVYRVIMYMTTTVMYRHRVCILNSHLHISRNKIENVPT